MSPETPPPLDLTVHQASKVLEIEFANGEKHRLPFELMRVYSPSAEVQGHGPGQEVLQTGKRQVGLIDLEPVGNYGIKPTFSDGHDSGIFTFEYLYELGLTQDSRWAAYQEAVRNHRATVSPLPACGLNSKETSHD